MKSNQILYPPVVQAFVLLLKKILYIHKYIHTYIKKIKLNKFINNGQNVKQLVRKKSNITIYIFICLKYSKL